MFSQEVKVVSLFEQVEKLASEERGFLVLFIQVDGSVVFQYILKLDASQFGPNQFAAMTGRVAVAALIELRWYPGPSYVEEFVRGVQDRLSARKMKDFESHMRDYGSFLAYRQGGEFQVGGHERILPAITRYIDAPRDEPLKLTTAQVFALQHLRAKCESPTR